VPERQGDYRERGAEDGQVEGGMVAQGFGREDQCCYEGDY
jgi:hypothetical protein